MFAELGNPLFWLIHLPIILFALTIHEFAHAWTADRFGDPTARLQGRVTLNPIPHIDPMGLLCLILASFGWGKPVPVNPFNLRNPKRDNMFISFAGPLSNLIAAALFGVVVHLVGLPGGENSVLGIVQRFAFHAVRINVILAVFNLIPLYPLDGSHVLGGLLPRSASAAYEAFSANGPAILLILILAGPLAGINVLGMILGPPVSFLTTLFAAWSL